MKKLISLLLAAVMLFSVSFACADTLSLTLSNPKYTYNDGTNTTEYSFEGLSINDTYSCGSKGLSDVFSVLVKDEKVVDVIAQLDQKGMLYLGSSFLSKAATLDVASLLKGLFEQIVASMDEAEFDLDDIQDMAEDLFDELQKALVGTKFEISNTQGSYTFPGGVTANATTTAMKLTAETPIDLGLASGLTSAALNLTVSDDEKLAYAELTLTDENGTELVVTASAATQEDGTITFEGTYGGTTVLTGSYLQSGDKTLVEVNVSEQVPCVILEITDDEAEDKEDHIPDLTVQVQEQTLLSFSTLVQINAADITENTTIDLPVSGLKLTTDGDYKYTETDDNYDMDGTYALTLAMGEASYVFNFDFDINETDGENDVDISGKESIDLLTIGSYDYSSDETIMSELSAILLNLYTKAADLPALATLLGLSAE